MICILISVKWIYKICQLPGFVNSHSRYDLFQQFQIAPAPFLTLWSRAQEKQLPPTNFCLVVLLFQFVYSPACYRVQKQVLICAFCNHASTVLPNPICAGAIRVNAVFFRESAMPFLYARVFQVFSGFHCHRWPWPPSCRHPLTFSTWFLYAHFSWFCVHTFLLFYEPATMAISSGRRQNYRLLFLLLYLGFLRLSASERSLFSFRTFGYFVCPQPRLAEPFFSWIKLFLC